MAPKQHPEPEEVYNNPYEDGEDEDEDEENEEEEEVEEKTSYTSSVTSQSRCSRGVATDDIDELQTHKINSAAPSIASPTISENANEPNNTSRRFEDGDPVIPTGSVLSRSSVFLQLIACGGSIGMKGKSVPVTKQQPPCAAVARRSGSDLYKGVVCKAAAKVAVEEDEMISCMSENPRFGKLQAEEKEYFSGSIVETMTEERVQNEAEAEPRLKKSSSYNEERLAYILGS